MSILTERATIEKYLRYLEGHGLDASSVRRHFQELLTAADDLPPTEDDLRYVFPVGPREWKAVVEEDFPTLGTSNCYVGWQYELSPGQREWLRGRYGMTPARTVSVEGIALWKGTQHPRQLTLRSGEHVNPTLRRHTLSQVTITCPGTFFREAAAIDAAREETKGIVEKKTCDAKPSPKRESLESILADLECIVNQ